MQRKALATAVALGLSASLITAPSANAAQIGAKKADNTCTIKLNDAEQSVLVQATDSLLTPATSTAIAEAFEAVFPSFKTLTDPLVNDPAVKPYVDALAARKEPSASVQEQIQKTFDPVFDYLDNEEADAYEIYLLARGLVEYPQLANSWIVRELYEGLPAFNEVEASKDSEIVDPVEVFTDELGLSANRALKFRVEIKKSEFGRTTLAQYEDYAKAYNAAQRVCADGGNKDVPFPTKSTTPGAGQNTGAQNPNAETKSNRDPNTGTGTGTKNDKTNATGTGTGTKNDKNQNDNTTGNNDDAGSSETGKIIGIVAGVLAAIGLIAAGVVAFAPQLGIQLPF